MQDAFINIMAGGQGIVEVNQRVRPDASLSVAFGRQRCTDQSGISATLNACQAKNVAQIRQQCRLSNSDMGPVIITIMGAVVSELIS